MKTVLYELSDTPGKSDLNDDVIIGRIHKLNTRYKELGV